MTVNTRPLVPALVAAGLGLLALDASAAGTRFGHPTSDVWRYGQTFTPRDLAAVPNNNPLPEPQPHRDRPTHIALDQSGAKAYVTLPGTELDPGRHVAVVELASGRLLRRLEVGARPYRPVLHPDGRHLVVVNELSNYASVIDTHADRVTGHIPLDFYCQGLVFSPSGDVAWVANRYLDQVLVVDLEVAAGSLTGTVRQVGGFDDQAWLGDKVASAALAADLAARDLDPGRVAAALDRPSGGLNAVLRARCGECHSQPAGGFLAGPDPAANLLSAVDQSVPGEPWRSPLVRAATPGHLGGYGDQRSTLEHHSGGALFDEGDPDLAALVAWIEAAEGGPGIPVGNRGSHPKDLVLSPDGRHLFVGHTGTLDVGVVDVEAQRDVTGVYIQNVANHVSVVRDPVGGRDQLLVLTFGAGFGAAKARDPAGAETWDRDHPAAQFAILRDPVTTDPFPLADQPVLGPFDAIDGTWNNKMKDIQNDLVLVDLAALEIPPWQPGMVLDYAVEAGVYEAHPGWVRYTSDTAEATTSDVKGDLPPELQRVPGAFPEEAVAVGDRIFVSMSGTFEVVEWRLDAHASDPVDRLVPVRVFETGIRPVGLVADRERLVVANQLDETISIIDRDSGDRRDVVVGDRTRPPLDTDAEKGELVAHTSIFSSDGDSSCLHCHYRDTGDGRGWGAAETIGQDRDGHITHGGTLGIPQMRNVFAIQPYYFEGTHRLSEGQGADVNEPASSIDFDRPIWAGDFTAWDSPVPTSERKDRHEELKERQETRKLGALGYTLDERRDVFLRQQSMEWIGAAYGLRDLYRFVGAFLGHSPHLLPNPIDAQDPAVRRGERIFHDPQVMCATCHAPPEFTNKDERLTHNARRALPPLTTITRRDASYTLASVRAVDVANGEEHLDLEPDDPGRTEDVEGSFTTMQLRGVFDRPPVFLHHGRARSLREVLCTPDHPALGTFRFPVYQGPEEVRPDRREIGLNETTRRTAAGPLDPADVVPDTHGGTSHLTPRQIDDLVAFMRSIQ